MSRPPSMRPASRFKVAFGTALGLEAMLIAGLVAGLASQTVNHAEAPVPIQIEPAPPILKKAEPPPPPPRPPPPAPPPPEIPKPMATKPLPPVPQPPPVSKAEPVRATAPQTPATVPDTVVTTAPAPTLAPTPALTPAPTPSIPAPPPQASVPAPALVGPDLLPGYHAQLASAAQAAFVLPSVAIDLNFRGKARISFLLRDGVASAVTVVQSSGLGAVDRAAVKAVQTAKFPTPPSSLSLKDTVYLIWVEAY